jgi:hypothetical protein
MKKSNILEYEFFLLLHSARYMSVSSRKKKNTDLERQKKIQRDKDQKKKDMRNQLPAKHSKN